MTSLEQNIGFIEENLSSMDVALNKLEDILSYIDGQGHAGSTEDSNETNISMQGRLQYARQYSYKNLSRLQDLIDRLQISLTGDGVYTIVADEDRK